LPDFRGKLGCLLVHGSILSRIRASTKFGAVHSPQSPMTVATSMHGRFEATFRDPVNVSHRLLQMSLNATHTLDYG
ncbi:hypothetical protein, partial [Burkholderia vietnamiensis]